MIRPGTFERVYAAIRQQLREGAIRLGERLELALLSDQLNASVTPVRDALHRLTGERLVEAPRHGFPAPLLTETMLRHLYPWHLDILLLALARPGVERKPPPETQAASGASERLHLAFAELVESDGNPGHAAALRNASERQIGGESEHPLCCWAGICLGPKQKLKQSFAAFSGAVSTSRCDLSCDKPRSI